MKLLLHTETFKALSDPMKAQIIEVLLINKNMIVSMIAEQLGQSQPLISHHLKQMVKGGVVICIPCGQFRNYILNLEKFQGLEECVSEIVKTLKERT